MNKVRAQKRIVEQRQKNVSLANNASKRDRDEIDQLRRQIANSKEDYTQKEKYHKSQSERLQRQITDLRNENQELREEIAHYDTELRDLREQQHLNDADAGQSAKTMPANNKVIYSGIGQGVLNRRGSGSGRQQRQSSGGRAAQRLNAGQRRNDYNDMQPSVEEFQDQEKQISE